MEMMELRVLRYFLAVAQERSVTGAAEYLRISQPSLSRQLRGLEERLGHRLFERGSRTITLTPEGELLRERAEQIVTLADRACDEVMSMNEPVGGPVYIGCGESDAVRVVARAARTLRGDYPQIRLHLYSGNADDLSDRLDSGLLDFAVLIDPPDLTKYDYMQLPAHDVWGLLMRRDDPLAEHASVTADDLRGVPLLVSRQTNDGGLAGWRGSQTGALTVVGTYNLLNNAALMVSEGLGCALCLGGIVNVTGDSDLTFRPLSPRLESRLMLVWRAGRTFSPQAERFLETLRTTVGQYADGEEGHDGGEKTMERG